MRRTLAGLLTATSLALGSVALITGPAAAAPSERSVHFYCPDDPGTPHPGKHKGWDERAGNGDNERRNVGGSCPVDPPPA
jgi:hypothetical protein